MKRIVLIGLLFLPLFLYGQNKQVVIRNFKQADITDTRAYTTPVMDQNGRLTALLDISMSVMDSTIRFDGIIDAPDFYLGSCLIHVAEGSRQIRISVPGCSPIDYFFPTTPVSGKVYEMKLEIVEIEENRTLILPLFSYTTSQPSYGLMMSFLWKGYGPYVKAKTNFTFGLNTPSECDANGVINGVKGWFTGGSKTSRLAITAGFMGLLPFGNSRNFAMYAYVGGGYGNRVLAWESYGEDGEYEYTKVTPYSYQGIEAELGLVLRFSSFAVMGGVQTNQFRHVEANLGLGFMF